MEWINAKDKPIPKDTNVWALDLYGGQANVFYEDNCWWFETFGAWSLRFEKKITHWMPLPQLPRDTYIKETEPSPQKETQ